jgi:hypothetical protein
MPTFRISRTAFSLMALDCASAGAGTDATMSAPISGK